MSICAFCKYVIFACANCIFTHGCCVGLVLLYGITGQLPRALNYLRNPQNKGLKKRGIARYHRAPYQYYRCPPTPHIKISSLKLNLTRPNCI
ncbi:hypothetical protein GDO86_010056 [Hymenochirus boettgeri]|uniref:Uncharacterized protein n=1 Tax=Hymenochirus boettgeri TaxID=247094 RepID=A0A8T2JLI1_9PIPI|nr:hypothetical protein GDO86_010056 [Hymenochirus boettgeri]